MVKKNVKISISSQKGGDGKTTTTLALAGIFADLGLRVLVIDMDSQPNASFGLLGTELVAEEPIKRTIAGVLVGLSDWPDAVRTTGVENLHVAPSHPDMEDMAGLFGRHKIRYQLETRLLNALTALEDVYDVTLFDCPGRIDLAMRLALAAADAVVVPIKLTQESAITLPPLLGEVQSVEEQLHPLPIRGVVPCAVDSRASIQPTVEERLREVYGHLITRAKVRYAPKISESYLRQLPVTIDMPSHAVSSDYLAVAAELFPDLVGQSVLEVPTET